MGLKTLGKFPTSGLQRELLECVEYGNSAEEQRHLKQLQSNSRSFLRMLPFKMKDEQ